MDLLTFFLLLILIGLFYLAFKIFWRVAVYNQRTWGHLKGKIQGPKQHWFWGGAHYSKSALEVYDNDRKWAEEFAWGKGGIFINWALFLYPFISICEPEQVAPILKSASPKSFIYTLLYDWLGTGLLTSGGPLWKHKRSILTPAFHYKILQQYLTVFQRHTSYMLEQWEKLGSDEEQEIQQWITNLTLDIIGECAFGYQINAQKHHSPYVKAINEVMQIFFDRVCNPITFPNMIFFLTSAGRKWTQNLKIVHQLPETVIKDRIQSRKDNASFSEDDCKDFLDIILDAKHDDGTSWTLQELREEVDTFMFEGHDTTANALIWTLYCMSQHPEVEKRVIEEVDAIYDGRDELEYQDLKRFKYLETVIKESQRLYPPVPYIARTLDTPVTINDIVLPANTDISIQVFTIHRSPSHWGPDPEAFRPERFSPHESKDRHPFAFVPFSAGPRNCIGQIFATNEEVCVLSMIYRRFYVRLVEGHKVMPEPLVVLRSNTGMKMTVHKR